MYSIKNKYAIFAEKQLYQTMSKYHLDKSESELLPNLQHFTNAEDVALAELEGFLFAELFLENNLTKTTRFTVTYIRNIHKLALSNLYDFAGKYRTVNLSKGGFVFPAALYIPQSMESFEQEILNNLPDDYSSLEQLIKDVAKVHAELLFIHPFREGNGRTARVLANMMLRKQGYDKLNFSHFTEDKFPLYIQAVQKAAICDYSYMEQIIKQCFEDGTELSDK